ncbi:MAG: hypothetical protein NC191_09250 [Muribaculaceae bacterium]|nr:hypothetical protein [Muribaculaceae bacterium]
MDYSIGMDSSYATKLCYNPYLRNIEEALENRNSTNVFNNNALNYDTCSFSGAAKDPNDVTNCLVEKDVNAATTESGNTYKKSNLGKILGGILGAAAPVVTRLITKTGFQFKPLAIACSALGLAGAGVGALIDSFTNSKRAEATDNNTAQVNAA